jgi:hypothetical protein
VTKGWWHPLVGVILGWILGQGTELWRQHYRARRYKNEIYIELRDIHSVVKTRAILLMHLLQKFVREGVFDEYPQDIAYFIFKSRYPEISLRFSESERLALVTIYGAVDALNANFSLIRASWDTMGSDADETRENLRKAVQIAQGTYINARILDAMIGQLLRDKHKYDIRDAQNTAVLEQIPSEVEGELRSLNEPMANAPKSC